MLLRGVEPVARHALTEEDDIRLEQAATLLAIGHFELREIPPLEIGVAVWSGARIQGSSAADRCPAVWLAAANTVAVSAA